MIDLGLLRDHPEVTISLLKKKDPSFDAQGLLDLDVQLRSVRLEVEELRHKKNELASQGKAGVTADLREQSKKVGAALKEKNKELQELEPKFNYLYLRCPNIPQEDIPAGDKENNVVQKEVGSKPVFSFAPKNPPWRITLTRCVRRIINRAVDGRIKKSI